MSESTSKYTGNRNRSLAYSGAEPVAVGAEITVLSLIPPLHVNVENVCLRVGISDLNAWSDAGGVAFKIMSGNKLLFTFYDEICNLLRPIDIPVSVLGDSELSLKVANNSTLPFDVAAVMVLS